MSGYTIVNLAGASQPAERSAFGQLQHQRAGQQLPHAARHRQRDASETFSQHADVEGRQSPLAG